MSTPVSFRVRTRIEVRRGISLPDAQHPPEGPEEEAEWCGQPCHAAAEPDFEVE